MLPNVRGPACMSEQRKQCEEDTSGWGGGFTTLLRPCPKFVITVYWAPSGPGVIKPEVLPHNSAADQHDIMVT